MTSNLQTLEHLESGLTHLVDSMLDQMGERREFLLEISRLDDLWHATEIGHADASAISSFIRKNRPRWQVEKMTAQQRKLLGSYLGCMYPRLAISGDLASAETAEEAKEWLKTLGQGAFRLTLKAPKDETPLTERFQLLLRRELDELNFLLDKHDHLFTCLDDVLTTAEIRHDRTYQHLAASMVYFLRQEGFKVDPYVQRLRRIRGEVVEN